MSLLQSIYRRFSSEKPHFIIGEDVADLWPSSPEEQHSESSPMGARRGVVGHAAVEEEKDRSLTETNSETTVPIDLPAIKRDSDRLIHDFMQRCVEIAVGQQIKEQALKIAKEKLDAAVAYHNILRQEYLSLCSAVARVSALRPWYRSEKYLAETRIELEAQRGPVREEDFWAPPKSFFDDDSLHDKFGPFPTRDVITRWDQRSWTIRSFKLLPWDQEHEYDEIAGYSSWCDFGSEVSLDDEPPSEPVNNPSITSLRSLLQNDLEAIPNDDDNEEGDTPTPNASDQYATPPWPSTNLGKQDRNHIKRLCERHIDPRRSSIEMEARALLKERLRERGDLLSYLWERIKHAQADHTISEKDDITQVEICKQILQTITEVEVGWEVHKEATAAERNRAQLLVLKMQWDLNGSKRLRRDMESKLGRERQKQMDVWQDIVCAADLRGTPPDQDTNIFGSVQYGSEEEDEESCADMFMCLSRNEEIAPDAFSEKSPEIVEFTKLDTDLFGPMESDWSGPADCEKSTAGSETRQDGGQVRNKSDVEQLRTLRLDSGFDA